jgi:hypothetical protein
MLRLIVLWASNTTVSRDVDQQAIQQQAGESLDVLARPPQRAY